MKTTYKVLLIAAALILITGAILFILNQDVLYRDDFSDPTSGWDLYDDPEDPYGMTTYQDGAYKIGVYGDTMYYWANAGQDFGDTIITVDAQKTLGRDFMQYGIICRYQDVNNWYALVITADGGAAIRKRYQGSDLDFIADFTLADAINHGNKSNTLRAECVGDRLSLYVNGSLAVQTNDSDLTGGDVGLMVGTFDDTDTEVLFDNFIIREP